jgi:tRNA (guanosine-2'-O-)-methyltransferase
VEGPQFLAQGIVEFTLPFGAQKLDDRSPALPAARRRTVIVLGNEADGIPYEALPLLDTIVEIPMVGTGLSLNVAVAGSLVLYKLAGLL